MTKLAFTDFSLSKEILSAVEAVGYKEPTQIQEKAIPLLLSSDKNLVGQAQTGTGKSAAFLLPILEKIDPDNTNIQTLILAPTRELAIQINADLESFATNLSIRSLTLYGGVEYDKQITGLRRHKPQVVVGTPGRVIDLLKKKILKIEDLNSFVLDEADEMLNMGFLEDVQLIMTFIKSKPQMVLFSATMPDKVKSFIQKEFGDYDFIKIKNEQLSNQSIEQKYFIVKDKHFKEGLSRLIDFADDIYAIVFCRTKLETKTVGDDLKRRGNAVEVLNGDMGQVERDHAMKRFKDKKVNLLVCTDVAARGIDVHNLTHVINYGPPRDNESYVHRIGRTGRAGLTGTAYTIIGPKSVYLIKGIERTINQKIEPSKLPSIDSLKLKMVKREIETTRFIKDAITTKGDSFRTEVGFEEFQAEFKDLDTEPLLKLLFTWKFNKDMRRYNNLAEIEDKAQAPSVGNLRRGKVKRKNK